MTTDVDSAGAAITGSLWRMPALRSVAAYTLLGFTGFFATMASLPAWLATAGAADSIAGLVTTMFLAATIGTQALVPRIVARWGLSAALAIGVALLGGPSLLFLAGNGYALVVAICLARGVGFGIVTVLGALVTARVAPPARHGEAMGIYGLAIAVPNLVALAGGVALVTAGLFPVVAVLGAAPLLALPLVQGLGRAGDGGERVAGTAPRPDAAAARATRRSAHRAAFGPAAVLLAVTLASGAFMTFIPIARPTGALATLALVAWGACGAYSRWQAGVLADRVGMRLLLPGASAIGVAGMGVIAGGLIADGALASALVLVGAAVLGLGFGATQNLTMVAAFQRARQREQAAVSAVWNISFDAGTAIGSGIVGLLIPVLTIPGALVVTAVFIAATLPTAARSARLPR